MNKKCRLLFSKTGRAKYISHLDLMRTFQRIFMRAGVNIRHTEGFNPHAYISIALPLPVCVESKCEILDFELPDSIDISKLPEQLTSVCPEGIIITSAYEPISKVKEIRWIKTSGRLIYDTGIPSEAIEKLTSFFERDSIVITKKSKKGMTETDIVPNINSISFSQISDTAITLTSVIAAQNPSLNPYLIRSSIEQLLPTLSPDFCSFMREEIYDSNMNIFR